MPRIPDRWLDYTPVGEIIKGTRFIAFKVPLKESFLSNVPIDNQLSCKLLLEKVPNLGMIIDLTNTYRYYDPINLKEAGVDHTKIMVPGHEIPLKKFTDQFAMAVNNFLQENADNDKLIGVHCTHGVNRTGYLISNYMISELKINPEEAIQRVEKARGHTLDRQNYKNHLLGISTSNDDSTAEVNHWRTKSHSSQASFPRDRRHEDRIHEDRRHEDRRQNYQQNDNYRAERSYNQHSGRDEGPRRPWVNFNDRGVEKPNKTMNVDNWRDHPEPNSDLSIVIKHKSRNRRQNFQQNDCDRAETSNNQQKRFFGRDERPKKS
ncbi:RNA/RNP complex-1-interacting phosphatase homolog [Episyrphus balteatus]|uniref:RNA/RNP complex-1-interacting phosphatase homolog n=1 Tax=Episyrphus balteatus TaxID=286459 RepID=UPI00248637FA|nr:RNA/RNP complex-1-interacting phosphatase homolog [Episyrphus balteatus]